jgi:mannose-6-phosphate isomerase-like protein (cupin superfamily)
MRSACVLGPGEGRGGPITFATIKAGAVETDGRLTVLEGVLDPHSSGPPLHIHSREDEAFYVLLGIITVQVGDRIVELPEGSFGWLPRGIPHTFANRSDEPARVLGIATPGGIEALLADNAEYFRNLTGPPDPERLKQIAQSHGGRLVGPPIPVG